MKRSAWHTVGPQWVGVLLLMLFSLINIAPCGNSDTPKRWRSALVTVRRAIGCVWVGQTAGNEALSPSLLPTNFPRVEKNKTNHLLMKYCMW